MVTTQVDALDTTIHKTNSWLKEIAEQLQTNRNIALIALRAVLHTLRDRLTIEETAELSAQLPMLIRGLFFEGWKPSAQPVKYDREGFFAAIAAQFPNNLAFDSEQVTRAVFRVLSQHIAKGEMEDIRSILPADLKDLWS